MRFVDLLLMLFVVYSFSLGLSGWIKTYNRLEQEIKYYDELKTANEFISKSFRKSCEGMGFSSLYQWQKECKALWNLTYISWCDCRDIMLIPDSYKGKILYGKWQGKGYEGDVYWKEY